MCNRDDLILDVLFYFKPMERLEYWGDVKMFGAQHGADERLRPVGYRRQKSSSRRHPVQRSSDTGDKSLLLPPWNGTRPRLRQNIQSWSLLHHTDGLPKSSIEENRDRTSSRLVTHRLADR